MQIVAGFPPNFEEIKRAGLKPEKGTVYCWGDKLYNPSGEEIPADIVYHEELHKKQQENWMSPEIWWEKYLWDTDFRQRQEFEAFASQYAFVKKYLGARAAKDCLEEISENLASPIYKLGIDRYKAQTLIRKYVVKF